ncbi:hypothetical protein [Metamycoplasma buccale]|uniref:hypothetical protein n=1 Tax=Metamycoplasma buccale TaxID=55602 RepID=UPI00398E7DB9
MRKIKIEFSYVSKDNTDSSFKNAENELIKYIQHFFSNPTSVSFIIDFNFKMSKNKSITVDLLEEKK